ncbi:unnamed protein product [Pylaiella littoralis]
MGDKKEAGVERREDGDIGLHPFDSSNRSTSFLYLFLVQRIVLDATSPYAGIFACSRDHESTGDHISAFMRLCIPRVEPGCFYAVYLTFNKASDTKIWLVAS